MHPQNTHTPCHELDLVPNSTFELSGMLKTKLASERTTDEARKEAGAYPFVSSHSTSELKLVSTYCHGTQLCPHPARKLSPERASISVYDCHSFWQAYNCILLEIRKYANQSYDSYASMLYNLHHMTTSCPARSINSKQMFSEKSNLENRDHIGFPTCKKSKRPVWGIGASIMPNFWVSLSALVGRLLHERLNSFRRKKKRKLSALGFGHSMRTYQKGAHTLGSSANFKWQSPLFWLYMTALIVPSAALPSGKALIVRGHDISIGILMFVLGCLIVHRAVSLAVIVFASSSAWLILAYARPDNKSIKETFQEADSAVMFGMWASAIVCFVISHCIDLANAHRYDTCRVARKAQDEYLIKVIAMVMLEFVGLLVKQQQNLTLWEALVWLPTFLSIAVFIFAAWDGGSSRTRSSVQGASGGMSATNPSPREASGGSIDLEVGLGGDS